MSDELKNLHVTIKWKQIIGMRNKLVHDYFGIIEEIHPKRHQALIPHLEAILETLNNLQE